VLTLEHAIHKLTFHIASIFGLDGKGLLRPGYAADLVLFDPKTVDSHEPEWAEDYPGKTKRLIQRSEGIHYTIVNGRPIYEDGRLTGDLPGKLLRGSAHRGRQAAAA
jgi:N-acyl-D-aspartate/D-glutamate deacylase